MEIPTYVVQRLQDGERVVISEKLLPDVLARLFSAGQSEKHTRETLLAMDDVRNGKTITKSGLEIFKNDNGRAQVVSGGQKALIKALKNARRPDSLEA